MNLCMLTSLLCCMCVSLAYIVRMSHATPGTCSGQTGRAVPLIGRAALDGSCYCLTLMYINALAIDFDISTLYWADAYTDLIETFDLNGW